MLHLFKSSQKKFRPKAFVVLELWPVYTFAIKHSRQPGKYRVKQIETFNSKSHYFSGDKSLFPVQNNQPVAHKISKLNVINKAFSITTYEFDLVRLELMIKISLRKHLIKLP